MGNSILLLFVLLCDRIFVSEQIQRSLILLDLGEMLLCHALHPHVDRESIVFFKSKQKRAGCDLFADALDGAQQVDRRLDVLFAAYLLK